MARASNQQARCNRQLLAEIEKHMVLQHIDSRKDLAARMGMDPKTLSRKLEEPERFSLGELRRLWRILCMGDNGKEYLI